MASLLGRTPASLAKKMFNLAHHDPEQIKIGITGLAHGSKVEKEVWDEFRKLPTDLLAESEALLKHLPKWSISEPDTIRPIEGREVERIINTRIGQDLFRSAVLASYDNRCCITGIPVPALLNASHIMPWSEHREQRLNPSNGLALNTLHDRAFDKGLITVTPDYRVKVSEELREKVKEPKKLDFINKYDGKRIAIPDRFSPDKKFLEYHSSHIFR